ncbi:UNVERIFIED_CONTAM: hypothetical protein Sradi_3590100 [Sesamum radiatum]|uniref:Uncharacterized protein n=1 Tax=Sesamum radiatum TaxID=300843 RepID=A0AAW2QHF1_SESRA
MFHFEAMWTREAGCEDAILRVWDSAGVGSAGDRFTQNLCNVRQELEAWEKVSFGNVKRLIKTREEELLKLTEGPVNAESNLQQTTLRKSLDGLLTQKEITWKQRGKAQ